MEILRTKWVAMAASIWIQCTSGASYTFGIYSAALKSTQSYDQSTLDTVSVFKDIGANAGVFSGLLYTYVTSNRRRGRGASGGGGPWVVLAVGAIQCFAGYFLMWASVTGMIRKPPVPLMCLFMFVAAQSQTFFNTANVVSAVENFADYGGTAVGIMKGFLGLSGAILIQLYETLCGGDPASFILLLAVTPTLLSLLAMPLVRIYETSTADDKKHLDGLSAVSLTIAAYLMIVIIVKNTFGLSSVANVVTLVCLVLLLALPLVIATRARRERTEKTALPDKAPLINSPKAAASVSQSDAGDSQTENMNLLQAMKSLSFWLLFLAMICGMGSGLSTINNIRQIGESLRYSPVEINSLVSLWSIWNFLGRFGAGYASDAMLHKKGWPRPLLMAATLGTMTIGHLIIASGFQGNLYVGSVIVGVCYGSQWSLMPTITSELFGVRHMGTIFNTISIASPIGSYIFSVRLIGYFYDKAASGVWNKCFGPHCFRLSFVIMASVAFFGFLVAIVLFFRTKTLYRQILVKRLHRR
ncbi:Nodulin-like / Major Facilitator Superfamily protein [Raphanus sativus]|uniref:Protein NUCLEAR FUSION DEFECTIVE 4 n=1 Tax=Raphanus sativus TaxID=3726 RepID=A0A6J0K6K4_RAPSA|nr:protein NUCLEAR FUSION DEFECTIVE 4 [Raphanus sativus]XP_056854137.1 protein NUCLEAR FUSION DEFECTIVE 4-like [Raphanus sativus]KAJ4870472.1 Nodulin-like / Major Facilitator Superfamily protein [Raphanus sativus]KAJ4884538.1 Nodulin-like / Major Facilitator Superfamily protein [Raphanus sativus]